jgi:hypothetical protein
LLANNECQIHVTIQTYSMYIVHCCTVYYDFPSSLIEMICCCILILIQTVLMLGLDIILVYPACIMIQLVYDNVLDS